MTGNVFPWIGDVMEKVIAMIQKMKQIVKVVHFYFVYLTIYFVMDVF